MALARSSWLNLDRYVGSLAQSLGGATTLIAIGDSPECAG
jgi:hypothetical protein